MYSLKVAIFDENMAVRKSKYVSDILYLYDLTQPSDPLILGDPLILFWDREPYNWWIRDVTHRQGQK